MWFYRKKYATVAPDKISLFHIKSWESASYILCPFTFHILALSRYTLKLTLCTLKLTRYMLKFTRYMLNSTRYMLKCTRLSISREANKTEACNMIWVNYVSALLEMATFCWWVRITYTCPTTCLSILLPKRDVQI